MTSGRVARAFLDTVAIASRSMADQLQRAYRFLESAWTPQGGRPWWVPAGVFPSGFGISRTKGRRTSWRSR
jgi:hypothetical protein